MENVTKHKGADWPTLGYVDVWQIFTLFVPDLFGDTASVIAAYALRADLVRRSEAWARRTHLEEFSRAI